MSKKQIALVISGAVVLAGAAYVCFRARLKKRCELQSSLSPLTSAGIAAAASGNAKKEAPKIIIAGAPGSGKGTQCEYIVKKYGVVHISTGDILREQVRNGTALGKEAKEYMCKGALVPDSVVIGMMKAKLSEPEVKAKGWLLDGFPRTAAQAKAMADIGIKADAFVQLEVPDSVLVERICLRRTDPVTGKIYHLKFNPPPLMSPAAWYTPSPPPPHTHTLSSSF